MSFRKPKTDIDKHDRHYADLANKLLDAEFDGERWTGIDDPSNATADATLGRHNLNLDIFRMKQLEKKLAESRFGQSEEVAELANVSRDKILRAVEKAEQILSLARAEGGKRMIERKKATWASDTSKSAEPLGMVERIRSVFGKDK